MVFDSECNADVIVTSVYIDSVGSTTQSEIGVDAGFENERFADAVASNYVGQKVQGGASFAELFVETWVLRFGNRRGSPIFLHSVSYTAGEGDAGGKADIPVFAAVKHVSHAQRDGNVAFINVALVASRLFSVSIKDDAQRKRLHAMLLGQVPPDS